MPATHSLAPVSSVLCEHQGELELPRLQAWLQDVTARHGADLYRLKAILAIDGDERRFVVHGVHEQVQGLFQAPWGEAPRKNVMIMIGHNLDAAALRHGFSQCLVGGEAPLCMFVDDADEGLKKDR